MASYRLYCLDLQGKIASAEWVEAEDDTAALGAARALAKPTDCELWLRNRMIDRIEATQPTTEG